MSGGKTPSAPAPKQVVLPSPEQVLQSGVDFAQKYQPLAYSSREGLLGSFSTPESANAFYNQFQPSSFEEALGNQYFKNMLPASENKIKSSLALSGMSNSPVLARLLGENTNDLNYQIGSYLSNLGNQRANDFINFRNINPQEISGRYSNTYQDQANKVAQAEQDYYNQQAMYDYQNAMNKYQQQQQKAKMYTMLGGAALGALTGGLALPAMGIGSAAGLAPAALETYIATGALPASLSGAMSGGLMGAGAGSFMSPLFGGSGGGGQDLANALAIYNMQRGGAMPVFGKG